jgi:hypothetical protein
VEPDPGGDGRGEEEGVIWHVGLVALGIAMILMGSYNVYTGLLALTYHYSEPPSYQQSIPKRQVARTSSWRNR